MNYFLMIGVLSTPVIATTWSVSARSTSELPLMSFKPVWQITFGIFQIGLKYRPDIGIVITIIVGMSNPRFCLQNQDMESLMRIMQIG
ncbi:MAG: hypothetical protein OXH65_07640 [Paracoccaceae bacterium]|nr:hypothetical protein [Paracoccaceae bacterium]MDE2674965.1 hypothetical protein [Paracoccaceae bacterium]